MSSTRVNEIILKSIPLNRKVKRYWISKYERIAANCGTDEAVRKFKELRVQLLSYLADEDRKSNLDKYLKSCGFRVNGMLRKLFEFADCQPHVVLSFVKMYSASTKSSQSPDQAAGECYHRLKSVRSESRVPDFLYAWLNVFSLTRKQRAEFYYLFRNRTGYTFHRYCKSHTLKEWEDYWNHWYGRLQKGWKSHVAGDYNKQVFPEIYKDFDIENQRSRSFNRDLADLISLHQEIDDPPLSRELLEFVDEFLNDDVADALFGVLYGEFTPEFSGLFQETSILSGKYVGQVQHIHKKGGGTDLRDIAVPNRFIQAALEPIANRLYRVLELMPHDATFDQDSFDTYIQNRVQNPNLYLGSVDLSKATDNLPRKWGEIIVSTLVSQFGYNTEEERQSLELFKAISGANWEDQGYFIKWDVGQPLGSLPSFAWLGLTHNILVEAMSLSLGLGHSPYRILGDDIVIGNKRLRLMYIRELSRRHIPLSLHKSFEGRLSEFAGKTYVRGCIPFYTSDHNPVTWNSLLDWQRTTGIRIPWKCLPRVIRNKIVSLVRRTLTKDMVKSLNISRSGLVKLAKDSYELTQTCEVCGRGSHIYQYSDSAVLSERISGYFERRITDSPIPEAIKHSGIILMDNGHPVTLMGDRFADHDGWFHRFRPVALPTWYKEKVRPCATDAAIAAATLSLCSEIS